MTEDCTATAAFVVLCQEWGPLILQPTLRPQSLELLLSLGSSHLVQPQSQVKQATFFKVGCNLASTLISRLCKTELNTLRSCSFKNSKTTEPITPAPFAHCPISSLLSPAHTLPLPPPWSKDYHFTFPACRGLGNLNGKIKRP